jgi:hypothetical protein
LRIKQEFSVFFPEGNDAVWIEKCKTLNGKNFMPKYKKKYADIETLKTDFETLFKHITYYYPKTKVPKVITVYLTNGL